MAIDSSNVRLVIWRWLALLLTLLLVSLCGYNSYSLSVMREELQSIRGSSIFIGYPVDKLDQMYLHINSIENFIRTTPLVECGDHYAKRRNQK
jgi:hypothetical protein